MDIQQIVQRQHDYFATGATLDVKGRLAALDRLRAAIEKYEGEINAALKADLNKSPFETYMCEVGLVLNELSYIRKRTRRWARDKRVPTPLSQFKSVSFRHPEPYGVVLVMAPWNYPFMLAMEPVVGAIAAGNCVVMKPSAYSPATSAVMAKLVAETFDPRFFTVVEGGRAENQALLDQKFDYIFFTGGTTVAREVMAKAAKHLTPWGARARVSWMRRPTSRWRLSGWPSASSSMPARPVWPRTTSSSTRASGMNWWQSWKRMSGRSLGRTPWLARTM